MTNTAKRRAAIIGLGLGLMMPLHAAWADPGGKPDKPCSVATLKGAYGIQIQGTRPSSPGGPIETVIGVVVRQYDGAGNFTQVDNVKGSISGIVRDRPGAGTYQVNADCSGVITVMPAPGVVLEEQFVIVDNGHEVRSITAAPPPIMVTAVHLKM
jgi:hypothetical protein